MKTKMNKPVRGGSWFSGSGLARHAYLVKYPPAYAFVDIGFRLVQIKKQHKLGHPVLRGGSWINGPRSARCAFCLRFSFAAAPDRVGFRLVRIEK